MSLEVVAVTRTKGRKSPLPVPELHLHSEWLQLLKRAKIGHTAWGSAGPDILVKHSGAILEVKKAETPALVQEGYEEIFARTDTRFNPYNAPFIGVITPSKTRIWRQSSGGFGPVTSPDIVFTDDERAAVLALLGDKSVDVQLLLDDHIGEALTVVYGPHCPDHAAALLTLLNLHKKPVTYTNRAIYFQAGKRGEREILVTPEARDFISTEIVNKFAVGNPEAVKEHIRHQWSQYQPDGKKAGLGKYYTPAHLVDAVKELLMPILADRDDTYVADLAAGCGAFLAGFEDYRIIGRDVDPQAVTVLREMGFDHIECENSLESVSRAKLGLKEKDPLVIVGNPPYNDTTSLNKRYNTSKKDALALRIDHDIACKDIGMSFMRAFGKLHPDAICVLHPLSYLIKSSNFAALKEFTSSYRLARAIVFSSEEFGENIGAKTPFAIMAGLYLPGAMSYDDIQHFAFPLYDSAKEGEFGDTGKRLVLSKVETIDGLIRKYPPLKDMPKTSDIGLYNYNIRDTNSLLTSGAITSETDGNRIPIQFEELWKYSYLNCLKRYFGRSYEFSNVSPPCLRADLEQAWFRDACIIDTILNHGHLGPTSRENADSFVVSRFILKDAKRKAKSFAHPGMPNFYSALVNYWTSGVDQHRVLKSWFEGYFEELRQKLLSDDPDDEQL